MLPDRLAICRLDPTDSVPDWASTGPFHSITRTAAELSVVCPEFAVPDGVKSVPGWRALKVDGVLDFALTGILASLAQPLAAARVSLFAFSTYDTDYVLVRENDVARAIGALTEAGHVLIPPSLEAAP